MNKVWITSSSSYHTTPSPSVLCVAFYHEFFRLMCMSIYMHIGWNASYAVFFCWEDTRRSFFFPFHVHVAISKHCKRLFNVYITRSDDKTLKLWTFEIWFISKSAFQFWQRSIWTNIFQLHLFYRYRHRQQLFNKTSRNFQAEYPNVISAHAFNE